MTTSSNPSFEYVPRSYLHFDSPIGKEAAERLATNPEEVARHAFFPFIRYDIVTEKIQKKPGGGVDYKTPKTRQIAYASHGDSHILGHYGGILVDLCETELGSRGLGQCVTAFRSLNGKRNIHFANEVFDFIAHGGPCSVAAMDLSGFFDNIDHVQLKQAWCRLLQQTRLPADHFKVFNTITQFCTVDRLPLFKVLGINPDKPRDNKRYRLCSAAEFRNKVRAGNLCHVNRSGKGIPQGSPISAVLSNLVMLDFDENVNAFVTTQGGLYRRYCDDIFVALPTTDLRTQAMELIAEVLQVLKLSVQEEKTELIDFAKKGDELFASKPLQYLGFTFDGRHKRIRPASVARYYKKMRKGVLRAQLIREAADARNQVQEPSLLRRKKLHVLYSYLGRHNFLNYAFQAARIMNDSGIKKQVKPHWKRLQELISKPLR